MSTAELLDAEPINAIAGLPPELAILRMENDSIQALAAARPRDFAKIKEELKAQITAFPQLAEGAIYRKPLGREDECSACKAKCFPDKKTGRAAARCYKCGTQGTVVEGPMKYANGLSVRTAETLAEAYGYNRVRTDVTQIDDDTVKIEATFTDYQRGRIWQDGGILTKKYKAKDGTTTRTPDDRFYNLIVKAAASKHVREVILRSVNPGLKQWYWEECEQIAKNLLDDAAVAKIVAAFAKLKVDAEALEKHLESPRAEWTQEHKLILSGVWTAIKEGETTVWEAFQVGDPPPDTDDPAQKAGVTKGEPLKKPNGQEGDAEVIDPAMLAKFDGCEQTAEGVEARFQENMPRVSNLQALVAARDAVLAKLPKVEKVEKVEKKKQGSLV